MSQDFRLGQRGFHGTVHTIPYDIIFRKMNEKWTCEAPRGLGPQLQDQAWLARAPGEYIALQLQGL